MLQKCVHDNSLHTRHVPLQLRPTPFGTKTSSVRSARSPPSVAALFTRSHSFPAQHKNLSLFVCYGVRFIALDDTDAKVGNGCGWFHRRNE